MNEHQCMLLEMLKDLDALCSKNGIRYQLFAGTLLGAVRHEGFIPWDDDLDVVMLRSEYERFLSVAESGLDKERYYIQREFSQHWPMQFSKLRRNGTACMERFHPRDKEMHQGVYLDIFPCDNLSDSAAVRWLQFLSAKIVIAKALYARGYETDSFIKKAFMQFCRMLPTEPFRRMTLRLSEPGSEMVHTFFGAGSEYGKNIYERAWFCSDITLRFEDGRFPATPEYDALLTQLYGDYRRVPDPEERKVKQHAAILDLHHPYTDYLKQQRKMEFKAYARSIR